MPYSDRRKAVFVWIPKTAGTSLGVTLHTQGIFRRGNPKDLWGRIPDDEQRRWSATQWQHLSAEHIKTFLPEDTPWEDYYSFSFVRNPWDRMVSFYEYIQSARSLRYSVHYKAPPLPTFEEWFEERPPRDQLWYLQDQDGKVAVNFVGKFETLDDDFAKVCDALKLPRVGLPKMRSSKRGDYRDYYDNALRKKVADKYGGEIEAFKYVF
jgi:Sulfotransferase family